VLWTGIVLLTLFALGPFVWVFLASLKTRADLYATPLRSLPAQQPLDHLVGGPDTAPHTPPRSERPGGPVALLDPRRAHSELSMPRVTRR